MDDQDFQNRMNQLYSSGSTAPSPVSTGNAQDDAFQNRLNSAYAASAPKPQPQPTPPPVRNTNLPTATESFLRGLAQGGTFGFADELEGAARGLVSGDGYQAGVARARAANKAAQDANPGTYGTGDVVGSVASAAIPVVGEVGDAARLGRVGAAAVNAATAGALRGAGDGQGLTNTLTGAAKGGLEGGLVGGTLGAVAPVASSAGNLAHNAAGMVYNASNRVIRNPITRAAVDHVGQGIDNMVDPAINAIGQKFPNVAQKLGDGYQAIGAGPGVVTRGIAAHSTGYATTAATVGGHALGGALQGTGALLRKPGVQNAIGQAVGGQNQPDPAILLRNPDHVVQVAQGTPYQDRINAAAAKGPDALRSQLYILRNDPDFRRTVLNR